MSEGGVGVSVADRAGGPPAMYCAILLVARALDLLVELGDMRLVSVSISATTFSWRTVCWIGADSMCYT